MIQRLRGESSNMENKKVKKQYFVRTNSGVIVCLVNDIAVYYLNPECEWVRNQEWYVSMFADGEDEKREITEQEVMNYIHSKLSSKLELNKIKKAR